MDFDPESLEWGVDGHFGTEASHTRDDRSH